MLFKTKTKYGGENFFYLAPWGFKSLPLLFIYQKTQYFNKMNWYREEILERPIVPFVLKHGDSLLILRVEKEGNYYQAVLRRKYNMDDIVKKIGTRESKEKAKELAKDWAEDHPEPKEARN